MAISPWHIQFSRLGFRAVLFPFFFCWGLFFFLKGIKAPKYLLFSALAFSLSLYTYAPARIFVPLIVILLGFLFWRECCAATRYALISTVIFLSTLSALALFWLSPEGMARGMYSMVTDAGRLASYYVSYFTPSFLFLEGDPNIRHSLINVGQLHLFEAVTVPVGLFGLVVSKNKRYWILLIWLILYPVPAALTKDLNALRAIIGAPVFCMISGFGLYRLSHVLSTRRRLPFVVGAALVIFVSTALYCKRYFIDYPRYGTTVWKSEIRRAVVYSAQSSYENVYIDDRFFLPHIYVLFYTKYPPSAYQRAPILGISQGNWRYSNRSIDKYHFVSVQKMAATDCHNALFVVRPDAAGYLISLVSGKEFRVIGSLGSRKLIKMLECTE